MSHPISASTTSTSASSIGSQTEVESIQPESFMSLQEFSTKEYLSRGLLRSPTEKGGLDTVTKSTHASTLTTHDGSETYITATSKTALFAPTARRLDVARKPHIPFRRPDTPYPRLNKPTIDAQPVPQVTRIPSAQINNRRKSFADSYHEDHKREDFKHVMFLDWLERSGRE